MTSRVLASVLLAACGRAGFHPIADAPETETVDASAPVDAAPACAATYLPIVGAPSRYFVDGVPRSWPDAVARCAQDGAHLFVAEDRAEAGAVFATLADQYHWLGFEDMAVEGEFVDVFGRAASYIHAKQSDPDHAAWWWNSATEPDGSGNCVTFIRSGIDPTGRLDDAECANPRFPLCECE